MPDPNAQIKYLGLIIEREEEYFIEIEGDIYLHPPPEKLKREYKPCRQQYIQIVKSSRKLYIEAYERKGR